MTLTVNDKGMARLHEALTAIGNSQVLVGWQGRHGSQQHPGSRATNAEVAAWLEYGTVNMPARAAVAYAEAQNRAALMELVQREVGALADNPFATYGAVLDKIGQSGVDALQAAIIDANMWAAPLAESTIAAKGHAHPWIDTETLFDTVEYVVKRGR